MSIDAFAATLNNLEAFRGLSSDQLMDLARIAERVTFRAGQTIIEAGQLGDSAIVVIGGYAELFDPTSAPYGRRIEPGSLLGEMAMLVEHHYRITALSRGPTRALKLTRTAMHEAMHRDPSLAEHFQNRVASKLQRIAVELRRVDQMLAAAAEHTAIPLPLGMAPAQHQALPQPLRAAG